MTEGTHNFLVVCYEALYIAYLILTLPRDLAAQENRQLFSFHYLFFPAKFDVTKGTHDFWMVCQEALNTGFLILRVPRGLTVTPHFALLPLLITLN